MKGRKVRALYPAVEGEVLQWEPLGAALTDALVRETSGRECWYASHDLRPIDGLGPLPSRREAQERARATTAQQLRAIRRDLIEEKKPWPGAEFGKALLGRAIDGAIEENDKRRE